MNQASSNDTIDLQIAVSTLQKHWVRTISIGFAISVATYGATFLVKPTFTAKTTIISPQQQSPAAAALASLSALPGLAGFAGGKSPADQYIAIIQSETLSNRIIARFNLQKLYEKQLLIETRRELTQKVRAVVNKKDNLISIEVDDHSPERAAQLANAYVEELRKLSNELALGEAQQRRAFFEEQLKKTRDALSASQLLLQDSSITSSAIKSDPKAAIESYARLKAEYEASQTQLKAMRLRLADGAVEIQQMQSRLSSLLNQLARLEEPKSASRSQAYLDAYRDYKYQEALFEIYARQFEAARLDEARENTLVQVLDIASTPEEKSKPKRALITLGAGAGGILVTFLYLCLRRARTTAPIATQN
ncbi:MAG: Wzz/FepE/Etk N-terminal domain-containing protein [Paucibacter sp.]|nr:Wzz/FepE/Etk N-terminal domain-containing protein [Roseateles sp.]